MRQLLSCWFFAALVLIGAACTRPAASSAPAARHGEFRVLVPSRPGTLNPNLELDEVAVVIGRNVFNNLVSLNEAGRLLPDLAESWTVSPDGQTYTFKLRPNVRWHDGAPFSSEDVRWTFTTVVRDGYARDALEPVASIDTPDPLTVIIRLRSPWAPFASDLAGPGLAILPRHLYEGRDWRTHPANQKPIGTGAFRFVRWEGDIVHLDANPAHFRSGPYVDRLTFITVPPDEIDVRLERGEADYTVTRPPSVRLHEPTPERVVIKTLPSNGRTYLAMNLRRPPLDDVRVRRALATAIDRLEILSEGLGGLGAPAVGWYTPDVEWAYHADARVPDHDPALAQRLLDEAGLRPRRDERLRLDLVVSNAPPVTDMAGVLQRQFAEIGVAVQVRRFPSAQLPQILMVKRDFDLAIIGGTQGPDPDALRRRFLADTDTGAFIGYDNADFREAVERGARGTNIAERAEAYYRAQEILARDVPFVPLLEAVKVVAYNKRVSGLPQLEARGLVGTFDFSLVKLDAVRAVDRR